MDQRDVTHDDQALASRQGDLVVRNKAEDMRHFTARKIAMQTRMSGSDSAWSRSNSPSIESVFDHASTVMSRTTSSTDDHVEVHTEQHNTRLKITNGSSCASDSSESGYAPRSLLILRLLGSDFTTHSLPVP